MLHQIHHSASRIETLTSFYKHPLEIALNSILSTAIVFMVLGAYGVHRHNYGDITWWDRLFGTFREADDFSPRCGYREGREQRLGAMLAFRDVTAAGR